MVQASLKICRPSSFARPVHLRTAECLRRLLFSSSTRTQSCTSTRTTLTQPHSLPHSAWTPPTVRRLISAILPFPLAARSSFAPSPFPTSSCTPDYTGESSCLPPNSSMVVVGTHAPLPSTTSGRTPWIHGSNMLEQR